MRNGARTAVHHSVVSMGILVDFWSNATGRRFWLGANVTMASPAPPAPRDQSSRRCPLAAGLVPPTKTDLRLLPFDYNSNSIDKAFDIEGCRLRIEPCARPRDQYQSRNQMWISAARYRWLCSRVLQFSQWWPIRT